MSSQTINDPTVETVETFIAGRQEPQWMADVRRAALDRFRTMEWPTAQDEEFRRSDVSSYKFDSYRLAAPGAVSGGEEQPIGQSGAQSGVLAFTGSEVTHREVAEGLEEKGVVFLSIEEALDGSLDEKVASAVREALLKGVSNADNRLAVWHYATVTHGVILYVPPFLELKDPFLVTFSDNGDGDLRSPQVLLIADTGARFSAVTRAVQDEEGEVFFNEGVDISVGDSGKVEYFSMQNVNIDSTYISNGLVTVGRDATYHGYVAAFGGMFSKYRFDAEMIGAGGDAFLGGVYFPHEDQHIDLRTVQRHLGQKAHSLTLYKGAVTDEAHSVYQGLISVDHEALSTDAYLTNNNLILGDDAQADSIPTLQINTDEVRCSHGSTTGKLDSRQLYYLETRGYSPEEGRHLLVQGYFEEILGRYPDVVSDELHQIIEDRIAD
jgi:Fe-S cluster assembly protein SufD